MFNTEGVGTLVCSISTPSMFYLQTKYVLSPHQSSNPWIVLRYLVLTVPKAKTKQNCHTAAGLLLYILQKYYLTNIIMVFSKVYYYIALWWRSHL
jgi:hypothetical protein